MRLTPAILVLSISLGTLSTTRLAAQALFVGSLETPSAPLSPLPRGVYTSINAAHAANRNGEITTVSFRWSSAPCPSAVKIKQFRRVGLLGFHFVDERGPFDVLGQTTSIVLGVPLVVTAGDVLGITALTDCGSPMLHFSQSAGGTVYTFPGDVAADVFAVHIVPPQLENLNLLGTSEPGPTLAFLGGRFTATATLTDPRTGRTAVGVPVRETDLSGYFSAPEFTGDSALPEIVIKMLDATGVPAPLGGAFWVFYASLTDTAYTITVTDTTKGTTREYSSSLPFCGGAATAAFAP